MYLMLLSGISSGSLRLAIEKPHSSFLPCLVFFCLSKILPPLPHQFEGNPDISSTSVAWICYSVIMFEICFELLCMS